MRPGPGRGNHSAVPALSLAMTTDHQVTEDNPPQEDRAWGLIATAVIVVATLLIVAWLATR